MGADVISLIIFGTCIVLYIWNKIPNFVVALGGLTALVLFNVIEFNSGFKNYGSSNVILICGMMIVGNAIVTTGLADSISRKILKLTRNNEKALIIVFSFVTCIMSAFLSNVSTFTIVFPILLAICKKNKNIHFINVVLPIAIASILGGTLTLIGSTTQISASGIYEEIFGIENGFKFNTFIIPAGIICVVFLLYVAFVGYPLGKKIWGNREEYVNPDIDSEETTIDNKNVKKEYLMTVILISTILGFIFSDKICSIIPSFNISLIAVIAALICIITGCIDSKVAVKGINWKEVIWLGATLGVASGLNKSGGGELITKKMIEILGENMSPIIFFSALVALTMFLTQFQSNNVTVSIMLPVVCYLVVGMGFNPYPFAVGITIAGEIGITTPLAHTVMGMGVCANYKFTDYIKYSLPIAILSLIVLILVIPQIWALT